MDTDGHDDDSALRGGSGLDDAANVKKFEKVLIAFFVDSGPL
jgi:hypothetical protein